MNDIVVQVYKKIAETPLQCIERYRLEHSEHAHESISYAGRLDPMAEGVLLLLVGESANKHRQKYLELDKEYEVDVLFGIETDTGDVLGLITNTSATLPNTPETTEKIEAYLASIIGTREQKYPAYSSKTVDGKPLFQWAREGRLGEIEIPARVVTIYEARLVHIADVSADELSRCIKYATTEMQGDFRQHEIQNSWANVLAKRGGERFLVARIQVACSSGTYMRGIAHDIGLAIGPAFSVALCIRRVGIKI